MFSIVWAKSQDSVHKPQFLKRKESRSGSNRGPSAYQPSALPLSHTGSPVKRPWPQCLKDGKLTFRDEMSTGIKGSTLELCTAKRVVGRTRTDLTFKHTVIISHK